MADVKYLEVTMCERCESVLKQKTQSISEDGAKRRHQETPETFFPHEDKDAKTTYRCLVMRNGCRLC